MVTTQHRSSSSWEFLVVPFCMILFCSSGMAGEPITNETLQKYIGTYPNLQKPHGVMAQNQQRLNELLGAFLKGDLPLIEDLATKLSESVSQAIGLLPHDAPDQRAEGWKAMAEVVNEANAMEKDARLENYVGAYKHFTGLTFQCIQCHQAVRDLNKFPPPPKPLEKGMTTEESGNKSEGTNSKQNERNPEGH